MLLDTGAPEVSPKLEPRVNSLLVLYGMTGFRGLLAEQALEKCASRGNEAPVSPATGNSRRHPQKNRTRYLPNSPATRFCSGASVATAARNPNENPMHAQPASSSIPEALDDADLNGSKRWSVDRSADLAGAVRSSLAAPFLLLPGMNGQNYELQSR
jgi:hypothetical protein